MVEYQRGGVLYPFSGVVALWLVVMKGLSFCCLCFFPFFPLTASLRYDVCYSGSGTLTTDGTTVASWYRD